MSHAVTTTELFLVAMAIIFAVPYLIWRLARTDYFATAQDLVFAT